MITLKYAKAQQASAKKFNYAYSFKLLVKLDGLKPCGFALARGPHLDTIKPEDTKQYNQILLTLIEASK